MHGCRFVHDPAVADKHHPVRPRGVARFVRDQHDCGAGLNDESGARAWRASNAACACTMRSTARTVSAMLRPSAVTSCSMPRLIQTPGTSW